MDNHNYITEELERRHFKDVFKSITTDNGPEFEDFPRQHSGARASTSPILTHRGNVQ